MCDGSEADHGEDQHAKHSKPGRPKWASAARRIQIRLSWRWAGPLSATPTPCPTFTDGLMLFLRTRAILKWAVLRKDWTAEAKPEDREKRRHMDVRCFRMPVVAPSSMDSQSNGRTGGSLFVKGPSTDHKHFDWETTGTVTPFVTQDVAAILGKEQGLLQDATVGHETCQEEYVEVKRPDGTARGERTFYGAFEGGFSAGYWGTVGSKEGWEPASFSSSRSKRHAEAALQVEDFMDEEDLRDHRSSRKTIAARREFESAQGPSPNSSAGLPNGLPRQLEAELFTGDDRLGTRLLRASSLVTPSETALPEPAAATSSVKPKKSYGCARPPPGYQAPSEAAGVEWPQQTGKRLAATLKSGSQVANSSALEAELERLWRSKNDLHGIGYTLGSRFCSANSVPNSRRLYMSSARGKNLAAKQGIGYAQFGTGVLDQDEYDAWEEVYDHETDKHSHYHPSLRDEEVEETAHAALSDVKPVASMPQTGDVPGFVRADGQDKEAQDLRHWHPPPVPRGYKGVHLIEISPLQEAEEGSEEHRKLMEFREKHGQQRLLDPRYRAELLGEQARAERSPEDDHAEPPAPPEADEVCMQRSAAPLWRVPDQHKQNLLTALGRHFVMGQTQDMDGAAARHEPFKNDPSKQQRYAKFCLAMEGKAAVSEALKDSQVERDVEFAEFGRVYRSFRQQHPEADIVKALEEKASSQAAPLLRRTVVPWTPDKLLCRRWGVPEPKPGGFSDHAPAALLPKQKKYNEQVKAKDQAPAKASSSNGLSDPDPVPHANVVSSGELTRPPKSLFASIFGESEE
ncbi:GPATCH1 [Symbiodinium sp. CCMP2592]|nr:GPATCH1 [Symbiodinium sp. CCMP2592]